MVTTGSKLWFGLGVAGFFAAIVYGIISNGVDHGGIVVVLTGDGAVTTLLGPLTFGYKGGVGDHLGYSVLMGFAAACFGLGVTSTAFRDADAESLAQITGTGEVPAVQPVQGLSFWPVAAALAGITIMIGLATNSVMFAIGIVFLTIVAFEWMIQAWSERLTGDPEVNRARRNDLMRPLEIPGAIVIGGGLIVFCISRILLTVSQAGAVWVALVIAALIFLAAVALNSRPQLRRGLVVGLLIAGVIAILTLGLIGGIRGNRVTEHETNENGGSGTEHSLGVTVDSAPAGLLGETA